MRTIKFRVWDTDSKKMLTPIGFDLQSLIDGEDYATLEGCEIMQFTGLLDKNGKEIYEGDIIEWKKPAQESTNSSWGIGEIKWNNTGFYIPGAGLDFTEIIGNIYQNPDLLS